MPLYSLVFAVSITIWPRIIVALMGSPPQNLPECLNGGRQKIVEERYNCDCPIGNMDRQCKLTRITMGTGATELQREANSVEINSIHSFHLGLQFITNEGSGNGVILVAKSELKQEQLSIQLNAGRPGMTISLGGTSERIDFAGTIPITNDNAWHHIDVFLEADNQNQLVVFMILDRCRDLVAESCIAQRTIPKGPLSFNFGGYVQLGADAGSSMRSMEGCVDKVVVQNELLDFYEATSDQPSKQGCLNAAQGCFKQSQSVCGAYGVCKNALRATDMLTCTCRPGYRPDTSTGFTPDRWPCNFPSLSWSVTSNPYNAKFLSKVPARIRLSMRTRNLTFRIFVVAAWNLYLTATNGIPKLQLRDQLIELKNINVSDGNWHLYELTITPSIMELQIDELDKDFFETLRVGYFLIPHGPADVVIAKDADTPCIDDVWVDFRDTWKNTEYDYPFENPVKPSYTRYVTWSTQGLTSTCPPGSPQCFSTGQNVSVCDATAVCVDEWRGVRCECPLGYVMDHKGICHLEQCFPNPCLHGECVSFTQTQNFTCQCLPGWTGVHCEISVLPMSSGLDWWWILLVVLLILLIILLSLSLVWCCPRKKKPTASTGTKTSLDNEQFGTDSHLNDTWDSGDKAFSGPFNTPVIQAGTKGSQLDGTINFRNGDIPDNTVYLYGNQPFSDPREHGQKTSTVPPWEKFEGKENPNINLDQALEYGYEGFDGRPPPEFCADEPSSLVEDEENADWLLRYSSRRASSHVLPRP